MGNINAKDEFLDITKGCEVIASRVEFGYEDDLGSFELKPGHSKKDYEDFLEYLDREYYNGYGGQELYGIIFCEDGVWMDRGEYDGSEWWNINKYPNMLDSGFEASDILKYERRKKLKKLK